MEEKRGGCESRRCRRPRRANARHSGTFGSSGLQALSGSALAPVVATGRREPGSVLPRCPSTFGAVSLPFANEYEARD